MKIGSGPDTSTTYEDCLDSCGDDDAVGNSIKSGDAKNVDKEVQNSVQDCFDTCRDFFPVAERSGRYDEVCIDGCAKGEYQK